MRIKDGHSLSYLRSLYSWASPISAYFISSRLSSSSTSSNFSRCSTRTWSRLYLVFDLI